MHLGLPEGDPFQKPSCDSNLMVSVSDNPLVSDNIRLQQESIPGLLTRARIDVTTQVSLYCKLGARGFMKLLSGNIDIYAKFILMTDTPVKSRESQKHSTSKCFWESIKAQFFQVLERDGWKYPSFEKSGYISQFLHQRGGIPNCHFLQYKQIKLGYNLSPLSLRHKLGLDQSNEHTLMWFRETIK